MQQLRLILGVHVQILGDQNLSRAVFQMVFWVPLERELRSIFALNKCRTCSHRMSWTWESATWFPSKQIANRWHALFRCWSIGWLVINNSKHATTEPLWQFLQGFGGKAKMPKQNALSDGLQTTTQVTHTPYMVLFPIYEPASTADLLRFYLLEWSCLLNTSVSSGKAGLKRMHQSAPH
jgi:hypothetical protein